MESNWQAPIVNQKGPQIAEADDTATGTAAVLPELAIQQDWRYLVVMVPTSPLFS